jgi:hypothetical protein
LCTRSAHLKFLPFGYILRNSTLNCIGKEINCLNSYIYRLHDVVIVMSICTNGVINLGWGDQIFYVCRIIFLAVGLLLLITKKNCCFFGCLMAVCQLGVLLSVEWCGTIFKKSKSSLKVRYYFFIKNWENFLIKMALCQIEIKKLLRHVPLRQPFWYKGWGLENIMWITLRKRQLYWSNE